MLQWKVELPTYDESGITQAVIDEARRPPSRQGKTFTNKTFTLPYPSNFLLFLISSLSLLVRLSSDAPKVWMRIKYNVNCTIQYFRTSKFGVVTHTNYDEGKMSLNRSTLRSLKVISEVDKAKRLMRNIDVPNEMSCLRTTIKGYTRAGGKDCGCMDASVGGTWPQRCLQCRWGHPNLRKRNWSSIVRELKRHDIRLKTLIPARRYKIWSQLNWKIRHSPIMLVCCQGWWRKS